MPALNSTRAMRFYRWRGSPAVSTLQWECLKGDSQMGSRTDVRPDDRVLVSRAVLGDEEALNELFSRYYKFLYYLACRVLGGREDAQDAVQNCMLRAVCSLQQFNNDGAFRSWLARILVNEAITLLRKRRSSRARISVGSGSRADATNVLDRFPGSEPNPEQVLARKESIRALTKALGCLSAPLRSVIILCDIREYSMKEAGAVLRITRDTVRSRLFRARRQLEAAMRSAECANC
jgi:RNA polymerase sigma factor (sigma-70 family)